MYRRAVSGRERREKEITSVEITDDGFASCDGADVTYAKWQGINTAM